MFLRRGIRNVASNLRLYCVQANAAPKFEDFRTLESNPTKHTENHIGRFYTIDAELRQSLFHKRVPTIAYSEDISSFDELALMVRSPAVEVINCINKTDFSKPVNRFVFYGVRGAGKTSSLMHLMHYGYVNDFMVVFVKSPHKWFIQNYVEPRTSNSTTKAGMIDINIDAALWLINFKTQNSRLLNKLDLKCSKDYVWSHRETTPAGSTLQELIEHGINRSMYSSDVLQTLIEEIKQQSNAGKFRTMVAIDGFNAFFAERTGIKDDTKRMVSTMEVTITEPFLSLTRTDWKNGVCVLTADLLASASEHRDSYLPKYLLHRPGFEHLDPFVPIRVGNYDDLECRNAIKYYIDRKYLIYGAPGYEDELAFLSGKNGGRLRKIIGAL